MNTKRLLPWLGLLVLCIGVGWLIYLSSSSSPVNESTPGVTPTPPPSTNVAPTQLPPAPSSTAVKRQLPGGPYEPSDPRWAERQQRRELDHDADWKTPFSFYGKVVDQNNVPVEDAKVHFVWSNYSEKGTDEADMLSDASGLFSLLHKSGKGMSVYITKDGYYPAESTHNSQFSFEFANFGDAHYHDPDSTEVVLFRMHKKGNTEPLYHLEQRYIPPVNSPQVEVSLQPGKKPDLKVGFTSGNRNSDGNFDWTVSIQGMNGTGFIESTDPQEFMAPVGGYQNQINLSMSASDPNWRSQIQKQYYVQLGSGNYARIDGEFGLSNSRVPSFNLTWVLNPSGSQNLEFNPAKQINK